MTIELRQAELDDAGTVAELVHTLIVELYIAPTYRSQGVGALLLDRAIAFARTRGWSRLEVGAPDQPRWSRTVDFYRRQGFVEVGPRLKRAVED